MSCCQRAILTLRVTRYHLSSTTGAYFQTCCIMPKALSGTKKCQSKVQVGVESGAVYTNGSGQVVIKVHAKPGSKNNGITDIGSEEVGVQISAPPVDGEANIELVKYLAKVIGIRKGDIVLEKGSKSRTKTLVVTAAGTSSVDVIAKLNQELENK